MEPHRRQWEEALQSIWVIPHPDRPLPVVVCIHLQPRVTLSHTYHTRVMHALSNSSGESKPYAAIRVLLLVEQ